MLTASDVDIKLGVLSMVDWTFDPTYVAPFYLHFMNGNIVTLTSEVERRSLLTLFRARALELDDRQLHEMLASSWRPAKVAAWVIAFRKQAQFLEEISSRLLRQPAHVEHFCICLARLRGEKAHSALLRYIEECACGQLQQSPLDDAIQPEWACVAAEYLIDGNPSTTVKSWLAFIERQPARYRDDWTARLPRARSTFSAVMALFDGEDLLHYP